MYIVHVTKVMNFIYMWYEFVYFFLFVLRWIGNSFVDKVIVYL